MKYSLSLVGGSYITEKYHEEQNIFLNFIRMCVGWVAKKQEIDSWACVLEVMDGVERKFIAIIGCQTESSAKGIVKDQLSRGSVYKGRTVLVAGHSMRELSLDGMTLPVEKIMLNQLYTADQLRCMGEPSRLLHL